MVLFGSFFFQAISDVHAAPILAVDFQHSTNGSPGVTQAGFQAFEQDVLNSTSDTRTFGTSEGNVDVTISGKYTPSDGLFVRGGVTNGGGLTFADLYNDFAFDNTLNGDGHNMQLTLSGVGISANTDYELTFYSYE